MIAPPRSILAFLHTLLAMALAGAWELFCRPRCLQCGHRFDPGLMRDDGRCALCHRTGKEGAP